MAKYARPRSLSGTADRACEVCFRSKTEGGHISPYSVYNLFITYFITEFTFCKLSYCNLKCFEMLNIVCNLVNMKRSRRDFVESKQQANIAGKRCLHTGIKRSLRFCQRSDGRHGFEKNISSCTVSYTALPMKTDLHFQPTLS